MNDKKLQQDVLDELDFEPSIEAAHIGVSVKDGIVTLTGHVPNYAQKLIAEAAVKRVHGVRGIAEELKVDLGGVDVYLDEEIAKRALAALDQNVLAPKGKIQVKVEKGWVTLSGQVEWGYQRTAVAEGLRTLRGVTGITNNVAVKPQVLVGDVERRIGDALRRLGEEEAKGVHVRVRDGRVTLDGRVDTWADRDAV